MQEVLNHQISHSYPILHAIDDTQIQNNNNNNKNEKKNIWYL